MNTPKKHKKFKAKMILQIIMVIIGGIIAAYGLETVLIPNSVSDGGVTVLASLVHSYSTCRWGF